MTSFNVSGLSSGIDTTSLISQLMTVAAAPQTNLKSQLSTVQAKISAYQGINAKLTAVQTAADNLANAQTWAATKASTSDSSVIASSTTSAPPGLTTTFDVVRLATSQITTVGASGIVVASPPAGIDVIDSSGTKHHIDLTAGTADAVASAVNAAQVGVRAAVINSDGGPTLQFTSAVTGKAGAFTVSGLASTPQDLVSAQDAQIAVGGPGGYTVSSSTNTFANALPGVTFTVSKPVTGVTLSVASDSSSISNATQAMVTAVNDALGVISTATGQNGIFSGDSTVNALTQQLLGVVAAGAAGGQSYATAGIGLTSTGTLTFDATAFAAAYSSNASTIQSLVQTGLAAGVSHAAAGATDAAVGSFTELISADQAQVTTLTKQISDWDLRLNDQKAALQRKYAAMESALSKLKSQSSYLASIFASQSSSGNSTSSSK
jgi:flagellar hook-associated protein 2